jgi:hypothetical protein
LGLALAGLILTACAGPSSAADNADPSACNALLAYARTDFKSIPSAGQAPLIFANLQTASRQALDSDLRSLAHALATPSDEGGPGLYQKAEARCQALGVNINP